MTVFFRGINTALNPLQPLLLFLFFLSFSFFLFFFFLPKAYGGSQARGGIKAVAAGLHHMAYEVSESRL